MATINTTIYGNDIASDIKTDYLNVLSIQMSNEDALNYVKDSLTHLDKEEECNAWLGLAYTMWKAGRLTDEIKNKAIRIIDSGGDIWLYKDSNCDEETINKRLKVLAKTKETLLSLQPKEKKISKGFVFKCPWNVGDIIAYKINESNYLVFMIVNIITNKHKLEELSSDSMYVIFHKDIFTDISRIKDLKKKEYKKLISEEDCQYKLKCTNNLIKNKKHKYIFLMHIRNIWTLSRPDYNKFINRCTFIRNKFILEKKIQDSVSSYYEFKSLDNTLTKLYNIDI